MSGIAGIIRFDGAPVEPVQIERMTTAMSYRGPDDIRHWVRGPVALGHCMQHTTPESLEETLPLSNEDERLVLVMDGRVDNWEALRASLMARGAVLRTRADAELVLRAYEAWGRDCLTHIDGDFALVIWDGRRREAFCARGRFSHKPFHYRWNGKTLCFASDLHAILELPDVTPVFNEGLLAEYLGNAWRSREETFWTGIQRLPCAHHMMVNTAGTQIAKYWQPDLWATLPYTKEEEYVEHYRSLLTDAVRRLSRSHHPLGIEVSGGLDSSALFAMAESLRRSQALLAPAIQGYTLDFHDDVSANELEYVRAVARHVGAPVREIAPSLPPLSWYRDWAARFREFPGYPNGTMAIGLRETARQAGCRVLFTGIGGDEWLGSLETGACYAEELTAWHWRQLMDCWMADVHEAGFGKALWQFARHGLYPLLPERTRALLRRMRGRKPRPSWVSPRLQQVLADRSQATMAEAIGPVRRRGQVLQLKVLNGAYDSLARELEERLSASLGIELRNPFFDTALVQFAFSTPERLRSRGGIQKRLHRRAMAGGLPESVLNRHTKADFMATFRRSLLEMDAGLSRDLVRRRSGWVQPDRALELATRYGDPGYTGWAEWWIWTLLGCDMLA